MMLYSKCNNVYKEHVFGKWIEFTCKEKVWYSTDKCYKCKGRI